MPSRLSSLLVRDGLVGVKRMEKAFQRQVIYGGSLDTILLEMNLVPEERLTQYLALASGLPPAKRDEADHAEADALATLSSEVAQQFRDLVAGLGLHVDKAIDRPDQPGANVAAIIFSQGNREDLEAGPVVNFEQFGDAAGHRVAAEIR